MHKGFWVMPEIYKRTKDHGKRFACLAQSTGALYFMLHYFCVRAAFCVMKPNSNPESDPDTPSLTLPVVQ